MPKKFYILSKSILNLPKFVKRIIVLLTDVFLCFFTVWFSFYLRLDKFLEIKKTENEICDLNDDILRTTTYINGSINNVIELLTNMGFLFNNEDKFELTKSGNIAANFNEISGFIKI